jgi:hypothetical protein
MLRDDRPEKKQPSYRKSIWVVFGGKRFLQAVFDRPAKLKRALRLLRVNKNREYVTDDPNNP